MTVLDHLHNLIEVDDNVQPGRCRCGDPASLLCVDVGCTFVCCGECKEPNWRSLRAVKK
jgi:hypothetical protein